MRERGGARRSARAQRGTRVRARVSGRCRGAEPSGAASRCCAALTACDRRLVRLVPAVVAALRNACAAVCACVWCLQGGGNERAAKKVNDQRGGCERWGPALGAARVAWPGHAKAKGTRARRRHAGEPTRGRRGVEVWQHAGASFFFFFFSFPATRRRGTEARAAHLGARTRRLAAACPARRGGWARAYVSARASSRARRGCGRRARRAPPPPPPLNARRAALSSRARSRAHAPAHVSAHPSQPHLMSAPGMASGGARGGRRVAEGAPGGCVGVWGGGEEASARGVWHRAAQRAAQRLRA